MWVLEAGFGAHVGMTLLTSLSKWLWSVALSSAVLWVVFFPIRGKGRKRLGRVGRNLASEKMNRTD